MITSSNKLKSECIINVSQYFARLSGREKDKKLELRDKKGQLANGIELKKNEEPK